MSHAAYAGEEGNSDCKFASLGTPMVPNYPLRHMAASGVGVHFLLSVAKLFDASGCLVYVYLAISQIVCDFVSQLS